MSYNIIPECSKDLTFSKNIIFYPFEIPPINEKTENKIPRIVHLIWVGDQPKPDYFDLHVNKWSELMPLWEIRVWTNDDITLEHFPNNIIELLNIVKKGAQKADILKYFIIEKYGGVYLDSDITPHRSLEPLKYIENANSIICHDLPLTWKYISVGFFGAVPNDPLFKLATEIVFNTTINTEDIHMHTGPRLLGEAVSKFSEISEEKIYLLPTEFFYRNLHCDKRFGNHFYAKNW